MESEMKYLKAFLMAAAIVFLSGCDYLWGNPDYLDPDAQWNYGPPSDWSPAVDGSTEGDWGTNEGSQAP